MKTNIKNKIYNNSQFNSLEKTKVKKENRYVFIMEYYDPQADLYKKYQLNFFEIDDTCEIFDLKTKRVFLRKTQIPNLNLESLYVGSHVTIFSRLMKVIEYGDDFTGNYFKTFSQKYEINLNFLKFFKIKKN